jgi:cytochrome c-type biogenesis protein CcmH
MTLWLVLSLMTAAAVFAVLWPLARRAPARGGSDLAVYRDQLDEIARDRSTGVIGEREAEAARVEVSRRLIAAADSADAEKAESAGSPVWRRRWTAIAGLVLVPIGATALYLLLGSPQLPGEPLQARLRAIHSDRSIESLVAQVEQHLARDPKDVRGYEVLAPVYLQLGRYQDAVRARRKVIALAGESAGRQADLGEALTAAANGVVTAEAKSAFERALALDAKDFKARFFVGMAAEQDGDMAKAASIWGGMIKDAPPGASWVPTVRKALAQIGAKAPKVAATPPAAGTSGPSAADIAASNGMSHQDRNAFIHSMVAKLAAHLKQDGTDVAGWLQLVRSYRVLGQNDKAEAAIADARKALAGDAGKLHTFNENVASATLSPAPDTGAAASGPSAAQVAAASKMSAQDRSAMINAMVARLAGRLKQNGDDIGGWQRLLRAYMVLNERDKAHAAAVDARRALAKDPAKLRQIEDTIKSLGLES